MLRLLAVEQSAALRGVYSQSSPVGMHLPRLCTTSFSRRSSALSSPSTSLPTTADCFHPSSAHHVPRQHLLGLQHHRCVASLRKNNNHHPANSSPLHPHAAGGARAGVTSSLTHSPLRSLHSTVENSNSSEPLLESTPQSKHTPLRSAQVYAHDAGCRCGLLLRGRKEIGACCCLLGRRMYFEFCVSVCVCVCVCVCLSVCLFLSDSCASVCVLSSRTHSLTHFTLTLHSLARSLIHAYTHAHARTHTHTLSLSLPRSP
jgi:hypothetical protein